jgi:hypothetical protein
MKRRPFAGEITKEYLQKLGVEYVAEDCSTVIIKGKERKMYTAKSGKRKYKSIRLYDHDMRFAVPLEERHDNTGTFYLGAHVLNYVWNTGKPRPEGMVIDHIDNDPTNNDISNLQCITQAENLAKDRDNWHKWEVKCNLSKPRSYFEDKLAKYSALYEKAKADHDAETAHKYRSTISQVRARIRYYDSHIEEAKAIQSARAEEAARKKAYHEVAAKKKEFRAKIDSAHKYYKEARDAYGRDDEYVKKLWGEWKLAIAEYYGYCSENKSEA